jgi:hypothetical protein
MQTIHTVNTNKKKRVLCNYATGHADQKQSRHESHPPFLIIFSELHSGHSLKLPAILSI